MKKFIVAAGLAVLSLAGVQNRSEAQVRVSGSVALPGVRVRVGERPYYHHYYGNRYYAPYYGYHYRPAPYPVYDDDYRRVFVPGHWDGDGDRWIPGHYTWVPY